MTQKNLNKISPMLWLFFLFLGLGLNLILFQPFFFAEAAPSQQNMATAAYNVVKCLLIFLAGYFLAERLSRSKVFFAVSSIAFLEQGILKSWFLWQEYQVHPDHFPEQSTFWTMVMALSAAFAFFIPIILVLCLFGFEIRQRTHRRSEIL